MNREIVITGIGMVGPCGNSSDNFFDALLEENANIKRLKDFKLTNICYGGVIENLEEEKIFSKRLLRKCARFSKISLVAMKEAIEMSELNTNDDKERIGVFVGNNTAGWDSAYEGLKVLSGNGEESIDPYLASNWFPAAVQGHASLAFGMKGISKTVVGDRTSGILAIHNALYNLNNKKIDVAIVGGVETPINDWALKFYDATGEFTHNRLYKAFDIEESGMLISEGAAYLVLESKEHALKRISKNKILARLGNCNCGFYGGENIQKATDMFKGIINKTGADAQVVFASGVGTKVDNHIEAKSYKETLNENVIVTCPKTHFGNTIAASAVMDIILAVLSIKNKVIPGSKVFQPDKSLGIEILNKKMEKSIESCLVVSRGYGGAMAAVKIEGIQMEG